MATKRTLAITSVLRDDDGFEKEIKCANGFVSRTISAVHEGMCPADVYKVAEILNTHFKNKN